MLTELLNGLTNILGPLATASRERSILKDQALRAICHALDETYLYYRDINHGQLESRDREAMLVKYWSAAGISLRHFNADLAQKCDNKAEYWVNPNNYTDSDVERLGIELGSVRQAYKKMLRPDFRTFGKNKF